MRQLFFITISILFLLSCNKDPDTQILPVECRLKTINFENSPDRFFNIEFNADNKIELILSTDTQTKQVYEFNNLHQFVKREDFTNMDNLGSTLVRRRWEHYYDESNNLIKTFHFNQSYTGGVALGLDFTGIDSFKYSNGHITEMESYTPFNGTNIYQGKTIFAWENDDLMSLIQYGQNGQISHSVFFTYDLTKENKYDTVFKNVIEEIFEGGHQLEGIRRSKHILTNAVEQWSGSNPITRTYTTTFDLKGLIESIQESAEGYTNYVYRFGYTCE
jgi:hypothetical protein